MEEIKIETAKEIEVEEGTMSPSNPTRTLGEEVEDHEDIGVEITADKKIIKE